MTPPSSFPSISLLALVLCSGACAPAQTNAPPEPSETPHAIILLIADGAGLAHWSLAALEDDDLAVRRMRTVGLVDTRGVDHTVSGSAPAATAYATGVRTFLDAVGVGPDSLPRESVIEAAIARGKSTGLVTTAPIVDATPAAFGSHQASDEASGEIARQMSSKGITVLMGGGRAAFRPETRSDGADLLAEVRGHYGYVPAVEDLRDLDTDTVGSLLGLFAEGEMPTATERGDALALMTSTALRLVGDDPEGFFLLIENEGSDSQSHRNADRAAVMAEMIDLDAALGLALDYQADHPETLVLVTGDHETGGLALTDDPSDPRREIVLRYGTVRHTGTLVPLFAAGPGAERFGGIIRNDRVGQILLEMVRSGSRGTISQ